MDAYEVGERIGALDARVCRVETTVDKVDRNVEALLIQRAERKGERRVIAFVATLAGGLGSFVMALILKLWEHSK